MKDNTGREKRNLGRIRTEEREKKKLKRKEKEKKKKIIRIIRGTDVA